MRVGGSVEPVRLIGIDTPEPRRGPRPECYSAEATAALARLVQDRSLTLARGEQERDRFDRLLAYVYADGELVQRALVRGGFARVLEIEPNTRHAAGLRAEQRAARAAGRGLWGAC